MVASSLKSSLWLTISRDVIVNLSDSSLIEVYNLFIKVLTNFDQA